MGMDVPSVELAYHAHLGLVRGSEDNSDGAILHQLDVCTAVETTGVERRQLDFSPETQKSPPSIVEALNDDSENSTDP
jgi:hypothetical protein